MAADSLGEHSAFCEFRVAPPRGMQRDARRTVVHALRAPLSAQDGDLGRIEHARESGGL